MEPYIGQLLLVGFGFAPRGYAKCEGQLLPISQNQALFSLLGTTYGGDGETSFALPDLRGRVPVGVGNGPGLPTISWGEKSGISQNSLSVANLPGNIPMQLKASTANASLNAPTAGSSIAAPGITSGRTFTASEGFNTASPNVVLNAGSITGGGSNVPVNNMQPYLGMHWVIALIGIFPSPS
jgi:microcystin-dependent protein